MNIIEHLNNLKIRQTELDFEEGLPANIYETYFQIWTNVASDLDIDKHRWFETSISVWETPEGEFIGVRSVTNIYSEQSDCSDIGWQLCFIPMKPVETISYVKA